MKTKRRLTRLTWMMIPLFLVLLGMTGLAGAVTITFGEVAVGTTDPVINNVKFYAGSPLNFYDTLIDDVLSSGNPYLLCGYEDASAAPEIYGAKTDSFQFASVTIDLAGLAVLPTGATFYMQAYANGVAVGGLSQFFTTDNLYHQLTVSYAAGFNEVRIFDGIGDDFRIDNFTYTVKSNGVPEPASALLLAIGLAGLSIWRKRSAV